MSLTTQCTNPAEVKWVTKMEVLQEMLAARGWQDIEMYGTPSELFRQYMHSETQVVLVANASAQSDQLRARGCHVAPVDCALGQQRKLRVYVCRSPCLTAPAMSDIEQLRVRTITDIMVLFNDKITYVIDKAGLRYSLEPVLLNSLKFNIPLHHQVPPHRQLTDLEVVNLQVKFGDLNKLPTLLLTDRVARYYNFPLGAIIAIERSEGLFYRRVRPPNGSTNFERFFLD
jgi:DNA-directed RNA polymerase subunit H (RpoH/RPB5)